MCWEGELSVSCGQVSVFSESMLLGCNLHNVSMGLRLENQRGLELGNSLRPPQTLVGLESALSLSPTGQALVKSFLREQAFVKGNKMLWADYKMVTFPFSILKAGWDFFCHLPPKIPVGLLKMKLTKSDAISTPGLGLQEFSSLRLIHAQSPAISQLPFKYCYLLPASEEISQKFLCQVSFAFLCLRVSVFQGSYLSYAFNSLLDLRRVVDVHVFLLCDWE